MFISLQGTEWHDTKLHTGLRCAGLNCLHLLFSLLRSSWRPFCIAGFATWNSLLLDIYTASTLCHQRDEPLWVAVLYQHPLHGPGMHCLRLSKHCRRTWHFVASWKHCYSRHLLKTEHDFALYLLHSVNYKFWQRFVQCPCSIFCDSVTTILTFIIIIIYSNCVLSKIGSTVIWFCIRFKHLLNFE